MNKISTYLPPIISSTVLVNLLQVKNLHGRHKWRIVAWAAHIIQAPGSIRCETHCIVGVFLSVKMNQRRQQKWEFLLILIQTMTWHMTWHLMLIARSTGAPMVRLEIKYQKTTWSKEYELTDWFVDSVFSLVWIFQRQVILWHCVGASDEDVVIILLQKSNFVSSGTYAYAGLLMKVRRQPSLSDAQRGSS